MCACLFREFQLSASYEGLIETVPGVNLELLRMDKYEVDPNKDTLFRGEFEVVKELIAAVADGDVSICISKKWALISVSKIWKKNREIEFILLDFMNY